MSSEGQLSLVRQNRDSVGGARLIPCPQWVADPWLLLLFAHLEQACWDEGFLDAVPNQVQGFFAGCVGHRVSISWPTDAWKSSWARNSPNGPM